MVYYGAQWDQGDFAYFNLTSSGHKFSVRFTAQESKTVDIINLFCAIVGTCPTYRIGLQGDSGGNPDGSWLNGTAYVDAQLVSSWSPYNIVDAAITQGTIYHIVVEYQSGVIDASNYGRVLSTATLHLKYPKDLTSDTQLNILYNTGAGWSAQTRDPCFMLTYTDATVRGIPYYQRYTYAGFIYGTGYAGEEFVLSVNKTFTHVAFYVSKVGTPAALYVSIYNKTDSVYVLDSEEITEVGPATTDWYEHQFVSAQSLIAGKSYQVFLESPLSNNTNKWTYIGSYCNDAANPNSLTWNGTTDKNCYTTAGAVPLPSLINYVDACWRFTEGVGGQQILTLLREMKYD